jgi:hypothetical protein
MTRHNDLTLNEVLSDPMILLLARADGWSKDEFRDEMVWASHQLKRGRDRSIRPGITLSQQNTRRFQLTCCAL